MVLTAAEFCQFNLKSRIQLLKKDGILITVRNVVDKFIVELYELYKFLVEVIIKLKNNEIIKAEPALNRGIIDLYNY